MTYYLLFLFFVYQTGEAEIVMAGPLTYDECSYTEAISLNDHAYMPYNALKHTACVKVEVK